ncbi:DEAD/DEAH box helicase [Acidocella sp.]|uniref:DEAD/DEAH box helicase n=1 Tax=Acidocella sp. TaxID=50710 RepID=UPI003D07F467
MTMQTRSYQERLARQLLHILKDGTHAYLEAPTGTGKTLVIALVAEKAGLKDVIYAVHERDLVEQTSREIEAFQNAGLISDKIRWQFMTWQRYASIATRRPEMFPEKGHLAIVDECHIGGVKQRLLIPKKAFPAIKQHARKVLWVSATPWELDEAIMGVRKGHTAFYSYEEAYESDLLNRTDLIRVDCSLNLQFKFHADEFRARDFYNSETKKFTVKGMSADATFEQLSDHVKELADRGLRTTDVPALVAFRWRLMAQLYAQQHESEKAIFWLPTKAHARDCAAYINKIMKTAGYAAPILGEPPNTQGAAEAAEALADWRRPAGDVKVACVVYRLREGFDYPALAIGFDCAWNPYNYRSTVQKVGRLIRRAIGKPTSKFYYAVDAVSIAAANRRFAAAFLGRLGDTYRPEALALSADSLADAAALNEALMGKAAVKASPPNITEYRLRGAPVLAARIPLFDILNAKGMSLGPQVSLQDMFKSKTSEQIEAIVDDIIGGKRPWPGLDGSSAESAEIRHFLTPSHSSFRPDLRQKLLDAGIFVHKNDRRAIATRKIEALLQEIEAGRLTLSYRSLEYKFLFKYFNPTNKTFRPEVRERLIQCGALLSNKKTPRGRTKDVEARINDLLDRLQRGTLAFHETNSDYTFIRSLIGPKSPMYDPEVRRRFIEAGYLTPQDVIVQRVSEKIDAMVSDIEAGRLRFHTKAPEYRFLLKYITPANQCFRPDVRERLIAAGAIRPRETTT